MPETLNPAPGADELRIAHRPFVVKPVFFLLIEPLLPRAEADRLRADGGATVTAEDGKKWTTLGGWLSPEPAGDGVLCRKAALEIEIRRNPALAADVALFPFAADPTAELIWQGPAGERRQALQPVIDPARGFARFVLPFVPPDATREQEVAGLNLYGEVVGALSSPAGAELRWSWAHGYRTRRPQRPQFPDVVVRPEVLRPELVRPVGTDRPRPVFQPLTATRSRSATLRRAQPAAAERATPVPAEAAPGVETMAVRRDLVAMRLGVDQPAEIARVDRNALYRERYKIPPSRRPESAEDEIVRAQVEGARSVRVRRPLDHPSAFPDLLREAERGWGSIPGAGGRRLHFRDTPRGDTFHYLPTHFVLGWSAEADGSASRPPMRPEFYRAGDEYRMKVTLVAVPGIDDADREALRRHLRDVLLLGRLPFVRLEPASGLSARFLPDFVAGTGAGQQTMPAAIRFEILEVDLDDRILLAFDMAAADYALFAELLRKGLRGTLAVDEPQESIPVRLDLAGVEATPRLLDRPAGEAVAPGVYLWQEVPEPAPGDDAGAAEETPRIALSLANRLPHPVRLSSLRVSLVDVGPVAGMIFDAEEEDFAPQGLELPAAGDAGGGDVHRLDLVPRQLTVWDETIALPGAIRVEGGSPQEWLDRVHQDPSLAPAELALRLQVVAVTGVERVQILRLRLLAEDGGVRQSRELLPSAAEATVWPLRLTLAELAGHGGRAPRFSLEYDAVGLDGAISLPQRVAADPEQAILLRPAVETADSEFTVTWTGEGGAQERAGLDRAGVLVLLDDLRRQGALWQVYPRERARPEPVEPDDGDGGTRPTPGPEITIVADLLAGAFADGTLESAFVTLWPTAEGAAQTTLAFDAAHPATQRWSAPGAPPFRYKVTYLFAGGRAPKRMEGTEAGPVLVLDPEG